MNLKKVLGTVLIMAGLTVASAAFAAEGWQNVENSAEKISLVVPSEWSVSVGGDAIFTAKGDQIDMTMTKSKTRMATDSLNRVMNSARESLIADVKADYMKKNPRAKLMLCGYEEHPLHTEIRIIAATLDKNKERHCQMVSMFLNNHTWYKIVTNYPMGSEPGTAKDIQRCIRSLSFE